MNINVQRNALSNWVIAVTLIAVGLLMNAQPVHADAASQLLGTWEGRYNFTYTDGTPGSTQTIITIDRKINDRKLSGTMRSQSVDYDCGTTQSAVIYLDSDRSVEIQGTVQSTTCSGWGADVFYLRLSDDGYKLSGSTSDAKGQDGNNVTLRKQ